METYSVFPWINWLVDQGPLTVAFVFFAIDFGVLSIMNVIDIIFNFHGDPNARPRGHLTFWMVIITDTLLLPAVGYSTVRFWQTANQAGMVLNPLVSMMVDVVATVVGLVVAYVLITGNAKTSYTDWTFINGRLNVAGWWHTVCMFIFVQYLTAFLLKGVLAVWSLPILWPWYTVTLVLIVGIGVVVVVDNTIGTKPEGYPIWWLTAKVFGHPINW